MWYVVWSFRWTTAYDLPRCPENRLAESTGFNVLVPEIPLRPFQVSLKPLKLNTLSSQTSLHMMSCMVQHKFKLRLNIFERTHGMDRTSIQSGNQGAPSVL